MSPEKQVTAVASAPPDPGRELAADRDVCANQLLDLIAFPPPKATHREPTAALGLKRCRGSGMDVAPCATRHLLGLIPLHELIPESFLCSQGSASEMPVSNNISITRWGKAVPNLGGFQFCLNRSSICLLVELRVVLLSLPGPQSLGICPCAEL